MDTIELQTDRADFRKLDQLLASGEWQKADEETGHIICTIMGKRKLGWLDLEDCKNFPPKELQIIDQLWLKYSQGKFGFSVQKQIWVENGGELGHKLNHQSGWKAYCKLGDIVGWREKGDWISYSRLTFSMDAPPGHFPRGLKVGRVRAFGCWAGERQGIIFSLL